MYVIIVKSKLFKGTRSLKQFAPGTGCLGKTVFNQNPLHPIYTSLQETLEVIKVMRVHSHSYWLAIFCATKQCWRSRGCKLLKILGKKTHFSEHPVHIFLFK